MVNFGFALSADDVLKMRKLKNSSTYGTYLKSISSSPAFRAIIREHVDDIDVSDEIERLKREGKLPDTTSSKTINNIFKTSISRMAVNVVADGVLLKEMEDKNIDDVIYNMRKDSDILYLLGMADDKYYEEAERLLEEGKLKKNDVVLRGLIAYKKKNKIRGSAPVLRDKKPDKSSDKKEGKAMSEYDLSSNDIEI